MGAIDELPEQLVQLEPRQVGECQRRGRRLLCTATLGVNAPIVRILRLDGIHDRSLAYGSADIA
jgi:hypothetical protein